MTSFAMNKYRLLWNFADKRNVTTFALTKGK